MDTAAATTATTTIDKRIPARLWLLLLLVLLCVLEYLPLLLLRLLLMLMALDIGVSIIARLLVKRRSDNVTVVTIGPSTASTTSITGHKCTVSLVHKRGRLDYSSAGVTL